MLIRFLDDIAKKVVDYLPNYQNYIEDLKKEGYIIVGYARKSTTNEDDDSRVRLLSQMIRRLRERSLVDKVFVSPRTNANDLMVDRDLVKNEELSRQLNTCGDAQGKKHQCISSLILTIQLFRPA